MTIPQLKMYISLKDNSICTTHINDEQYYRVMFAVTGYKETIMLHYLAATNSI